jgi:hypothetical protein
MNDLLHGTRKESLEERMNSARHGDPMAIISLGGHLGEDIMMILVRTLGHADLNASEAAMQAIEQTLITEHIVTSVGYAHLTSVRYFEEYLKASDNPRAKRNGLRFAARCDHLPCLSSSFLDDPDEEVRLTAVKLAGGVGFREWTFYAGHRERLVAILQDTKERPDIRGAAAKSLAQIACDTKENPASTAIVALKLFTGVLERLQRKGCDMKFESEQMHAMVLDIRNAMLDVVSQIGTTVLNSK